jgi:hypothetical protein
MNMSKLRSGTLFEIVIDIMLWSIFLLSYLYVKSFFFLIGNIFKKSLSNPPPLSGIQEVNPPPTILPDDNTRSFSRCDSHLLGQDSEGDGYHSEHGFGDSLGSFSFGEESTTIATMQ